jgi:hypothetical protein
MAVIHLTAKTLGKKRQIVSIETYAPVPPLPNALKAAPKAKAKAAPKAAPKPVPKASKGNKNSK